MLTSHAIKANDEGFRVGDSTCILFARIFPYTQASDLQCRESQIGNPPLFSGVLS